MHARGSVFNRGHKEVGGHYIYVDLEMLRNETQTALRGGYVPSSYGTTANYEMRRHVPQIESADDFKLGKRDDHENR